MSDGACLVGCHTGDAVASCTPPAQLIQAAPDADPHEPPGLHRRPRWEVSASTAITSGGSLSCWGDNTFGELGNNSTASSGVPVQVQGLTSGVSAVSVGIDYACAALSDGTLDCWGDNTSAQLGDGSTMTRLVPTPVSGLTGVTAVSAGWYAACAVTSGALVCWGDNSFSELGNSSTSGSLVPIAVTGASSGATQVAIGQQTACAIVSGGVQCWGAQALGSGTTGTESAPVPVTGLSTGATSIAVGAGSACAVVNGGVRCWGYNTAGQLGNGGAVNAFQPTPVPRISLSAFLRRDSRARHVEAGPLRVTIAGGGRASRRSSRGPLGLASRC